MPVPVPVPVLVLVLVLVLARGAWRASNRTCGAICSVAPTTAEGGVLCFNQSIVSGKDEGPAIPRGECVRCSSRVLPMLHAKRPTTGVCT